MSSLDEWEDIYHRANTTTIIAITRRMRFYFRRHRMRQQGAVWIKQLSQIFQFLYGHRSKPGVTPHSPPVYFKGTRSVLVPPGENWRVEPKRVNVTRKLPIELAMLQAVTAFWLLASVPQPSHPMILPAVLGSSMSLALVAYMAIEIIKKQLVKQH